MSSQRTPPRGHVESGTSGHPANAAWLQIEALLTAALELPPEARPSFLDSACAADPMLRAEVAALVAASEQAGVVDTPVATLTGLLADLEAIERTRQLEPGSRLGPYVIAAHLGAGGMGQVYRARDTRLDRDVAIKIVAPHLQRDAASRKRLEREARVIASLSHPNIVAIFDIGDHDGLLYVVTELLTGRTLREMIESAPLDEPTVVDVAGQVARGLSAAHARQVVHRDLKPENLFVTQEGVVKILDFGLAKPHQSNAERHTGAITSPLTVLGTIGYMSPEQLTGDDLDPRTDLFSLGAVLYEVATGVPPFSGKTRSEVAAAILSSSPSLSDRADISPLLRQTISRCLAKTPADRYQSASDLAFTLQLLASNTANPALSIETHARVRVSRRRRWVLAALGAAAVIAVGMAVSVRPVLRPTNADQPPITFVLHAPKGASFERQTMQPFPAVSPDGRQLAFVATSGSQRMIWVQTLGELETRPLARAAGTGPFWSADGNGRFERRVRCWASWTRAPLLRARSSPSGTEVRSVERGIGGGSDRRSEARDPGRGRALRTLCRGRQFAGVSVDESFAHAADLDDSQRCPSRPNRQRGRKLSISIALARRDEACGPDRRRGYR
jgi:serine/threonine protein kinase